LEYNIEGEVEKPIKLSMEEISKSFLLKKEFIVKMC
jgi:DMSO/TMAO reductase YedYZ molybdopterin-dependent catalytic subunit